MTDNLKSANSAKTGKVFQDARIEQKLTTDEIANKTLINIKYIKAIESGDYSDFPSEAFAKAYFIKYQSFLNIECEFPSIYIQENRKEQIVKKSVAVFNKSFKKIVIAMGLVISILIISIFLKALFSNTEIQLKQQNINEISKDSLSTMVNIVNNNKTLIDFEKDDQEIETLKIENQLKLTFIDECWIELYSGETLIENQLFQSGDFYQVIIQMPYKIIVGNADAVIGAYNGIEIDFITNANRLNVNTIIFNDE